MSVIRNHRVQQACSVYFLYGLSNCWSLIAISLLCGQSIRKKITLTLLHHRGESQDTHMFLFLGVAIIFLLFFLSYNRPLPRKRNLREAPVAMRGTWNVHTACARIRSSVSATRLKILYIRESHRGTRPIIWTPTKWFRKEALIGGPVQRWMRSRVWLHHQMNCYEVLQFIWKVRARVIPNLLSFLRPHHSYNLIIINNSNL